MAKRVPSSQKSNRSASGDPPTVPSERLDGDWMRLPPFLAPLIVFIISTCLLCCNLGARYLWQDEAQTALLAQRMMSFGRPLAYDGRNLLTMDLFSSEAESRIPTGDPEESVRYHVRRGDFKDDTTWIGHPWGQFVVAGVFLSVLGNDTIPARLPFVLAGALTATLLFLIVRKRLSSSMAAAISVALVLSNSFWVMHMRQCRYYALSSLFLLLTLESYLRWKEGKRWGGVVFLGTAWVWFQMDYGSLWPVLGVLGLDSLITRARPVRETALVFAGFFASTVPFCIYYELARRSGFAATPLSDSIWIMLFKVNLFLFPLTIIPAVLCLFFIKRKSNSGSQPPSLVGLSLVTFFIFVIWMLLVTPYPFYRYIVPATTLSAIVIGYLIAESSRLVPRAKDYPWLAPSVAVSATLLFSITNLLSWPGIYIVPPKSRIDYYISSFVRPELRLLIDDLAATGNDPNRAVVEFLRKRIKPDDEVVINYEDNPLMFYLPNRIRGGISCFRVTAPPENVRFLVYRRSVLFSHAAIYSRNFQMDRWEAHSVDAPDIPWGNFPDPEFHYAFLSTRSPPPITVLERVAP
jgi:hypothetical protein